MNKDSLINFKNLINNYEIKYKSSLDKDIDLQNILSKSKEITENLLDIYERDLLLLQKIDKLLTNNNSINDREDLLKVQKELMEEFRQLNNTISHISGSVEVNIPEDNIEPNISDVEPTVITSDNSPSTTDTATDTTTSTSTSSKATSTPTSTPTPTTSPSTKTKEEESTSLLENIKNLFAKNLYFYKDTDGKGKNNSVVNTILSSDEKNKSSKKSNDKKIQPKKPTSKNTKPKKSISKTTKSKKTIKKSNSKVKLPISIPQVILPNYNIDKDNHISVTVKKQKKCDYELETINNNFPKIKQFRRKTRKKQKHKINR